MASIPTFLPDFYIGCFFWHLNNFIFICDVVVVVGSKASRDRRIKLKLTPASLSGRSRPVGSAPLDQWGILGISVPHVIRSLAAVAVAHPLGVPSKAHLHGGIDFGHG